MDKKQIAFQKLVSFVEKFKGLEDNYNKGGKI